MPDIAQDGAILNAVLVAAPDAIIVADVHGKVIRSNPAAAELFGYAPGDLTGQNVNILMPKAMADLHDGFMRHHLETGERRIIGKGRDVEGLRKDGQVFPLRLSVGRADIDGQPVFVGILHDLSRRRAAEDALARSQRLDAIGQMTGGIAHDFNNLLTVIIGNLELLQIRGVEEKQAMLVRDSLDAAELGADMTARLLVFARKGDLKPVLSDLRVLCDDALALLKRTIGEAYTLRTEYSASVSPVLVDPVQMQSALINLAINARDAMPEGGELLISISDVRIDDTYIAQETDIAPGEYVRLVISDDGQGMTPDAQRRAFEPFFTTKSDQGGSGLGLAMVYGFVRQSGGHVTLYSELGHGTSFGLYFPVSHAEEHVTPLPKQGQTRTQRGNGQVVLVVEDNPKVRRLSVERVRDLGYIAEEAKTGDEAYAFLQRGNAVDLVFSDLVMPGSLNGYDLAAKVRQDFPGVAVLLTSGYASDVVTGRMGGSPEYDILHKPYRQADLAARLQALLGAASEGG